MAAAGEFDADLDDDALEELFKLEEQAMSSSTQNRQIPKPSASVVTTTSHPPPPPPPPQPQPIAVAVSRGSFDCVSYSPPRQLSQLLNYGYDTLTVTNPSVSLPSAQRTPPPTTTQQLHEIHRLKSELNQASKQLSDLKQECLELRKERDKSRQLKSVYSNRDAGTRSEPVILDHAKTATNHLTSRNNIEQKSIAIQTDKSDEDESTHASTSGTASTYFSNPELLSIWFLEGRNKSRRSFGAKLLEMCADDFCSLFRFLSPNMNSKVEIRHLSLAPLTGNVHSPNSAEVARISQLYSVLAQLNDDMVDVDALVEVLLDLCSLDNVLVVRRSLHILHVALDHLLSIDRRRPKRDNVKVERCQSESDAVHNCYSTVRKRGGMNDVGETDASSSHCTTAQKNVGISELENMSLLCHLDWSNLFDSLRKIAVRLTEEHARMEAVAIMNVILLTTDAYCEREKFGGTLVFEAVALLLRKEAGLFCRKEAVHILHLLLNCPNILGTFCTNCRVAEDDPESSDLVAKNPDLKASWGILQGLADCIVGCEHGVKELILCRNAIIVLAFLASSGKLGLEIVLFHKLSNKANFLGLILQVLLSEAEKDAFDSCPAPEVSKERTLLLREALILLNRLASQPAYSGSFSQVMRSSRDMVSLAVEVGNRLSKKSSWLLKSDNITRQMRESEVVELARAFKKRVFSFLGEA